MTLGSPGMKKVPWTVNAQRTEIVLTHPQSLSLVQGLARWRPTRVIRLMLGGQQIAVSFEGE